MRKFIGFIFGSLFLNSLAFGQPDNLQPAKGVFDINPISFSYYSEVRSYLVDSVGISEVQYIEIPSWGPEQLLTIHKTTEGKIWINLRHPNQSIWYARTKEPKPEIEIFNFWKTLEKNDFELIHKLINSALEQTETYITNTWRPDVSKYYFSIRIAGMPTGTTESPKTGTNMRELVDIMKSLIELTKKEGTDELLMTDELRNRISGLTEKISIANKR